MHFIILAIQLAGPILSTLNIVWNILPDCQEFKAGNVEATLTGFYLPVTRDVIASLIGFLVPSLAPKWREILAWFRGLLPDGTARDPHSAISKLMAAVERENRENLRVNQHNRTVLISGKGDLLPLKSEAQEALGAAMSRIPIEKYRSDVAVPLDLLAPPTITNGPRAQAVARDIARQNRKAASRRKSAKPSQPAGEGGAP